MSQEEVHPNTDSPPEPIPYELILLSTFSFPSHSSPYLEDEDVTCFLNGWVTLWHPALLINADGLAKITDPHDHDPPSAGHVYAVPEVPHSHLPEDWEEKVREVGAIAFTATTDREQTLQNLRDALREHADAGGQLSETQRKLLEIDLPELRPFSGIGFGYGHLDSMFETMDHENVIDTYGVVDSLKLASQQAAGEAPVEEEGISGLQAAANLLLEAREVLYQAEMFIIDIYLLEPNRFDEGWPAGIENGLPLNVLATGEVLEKFAQAQPERLAQLRERVGEDLAEVCGGGYSEREESLMPIESQMWNLLKGTKVSEELLGREVTVFGRKRFYAHPQTPAFLYTTGLERALLLSFSEAVLPYYHSSLISWPAADGKQVDAFCKPPVAAHNPQTFYHLGHHLHETLMHDHYATFSMIHAGPVCDWYKDWQELSKLAPVLGKFTTVSQYVEEVDAGDYASAASADEFQGEYLVERTQSPDEPVTEGYENEVRLRTFHAGEETRKHPVSSFANHGRLRRALDAAWTFAGIYRSLAGAEDDSNLDQRITEVEDQFEKAGPVPPSRTDLTEAVEGILQQSADTLAGRIMRKGTEETPGYLVLNPCSFGRRAMLELDDLKEPIRIEGPVKACQIDEDKARLVVEIPAMGFAWIPATGAASNAARPRMRMADELCVRNQFFEAEIDPKTGGLKGIRDHRTRINRMGQQLVFNPGSKLRVREMKTTSEGPAYGEIVTEGDLINDHDEVLATFRQRFRAWEGRRVLDVRIEIDPQQPVEGHPWHAYFGARFAWADERAMLVRGVGSLGHVTSQMRPETTDYLDFRFGGSRKVAIFPGGLPFHQRQGGRMIDVILRPQGEQENTFDLAIGMDHNYPMLVSHGMMTPVAVVKTTNGLPMDRSSSWLFHLDALNLMVSSLRPAPEGAHAVIGRLLEHVGHAGNASLRCARDPVRAELTDARGVTMMETNVEGDTVLLDVAEGEMLNLRVEFS